MTSGMLVGSNVRIRVSTLAGERDFEGTLLPPAGQGLVTLKLVNGYNLSYPEKDVPGYHGTGNMERRCLRKIHHSRRMNRYQRYY